MSLFKINPNTTIPSEQRQLAYQTMLRKEDGAILIKWYDDNLTVDDANKIYSDYKIEGKTDIEDLRLMILNAKEYIRGLYPDK